MDSMLTIYEACKMAVFIPSLYQMHDLFLPLFSLYSAWFLPFLRHTDGFACRQNEFPLLTKIYWRCFRSNFTLNVGGGGGGGCTKIRPTNY